MNDFPKHEQGTDRHRRWLAATGMGRMISDGRQPYRNPHKKASRRDFRRINAEMRRHER